MKNRDFKDSRLLEAFDYIDQKYIAEVADSLKFEKSAPMPAKGFNRRTWRHIIALAACMLLLGAIIPVLSYVIRNFTDFSAWFPKDTTEESYPLTEPETPPEETTTLPPDTTEEETTSPPETTGCTHSDYTATDNAPTCTESATVNYSCSSCGHTWSEVLPALGHNFVGGICTRCGTLEENYVSAGLEYKAFDSYAVLVGIGTCTDKDIVIASEYNGLPVTEIWHEAFVGVKGMTSVKIPEGVTYIESHAFENCPDLRAVYLPSTLENITGSLLTHGFYNCPAIETIEIAEGGKKYYSVGNCLIEKQTGTLVFGCGKSAIPNDGSVKSIGAYAFSGCRNLTSLALPEGVTDILTGAFAGCENLKSLTLPKSLKTIRQKAFEGCSSLTAASIPEGVTEIYDGAFRGCAKLKNVTLPNSLTLLDSEAFLGTAIESIVIPNGVKELGAVFSECEKLVSVTLPAGFEGFVGNTFAGCKSLKSLTLPKSLKRIGMYTFYGCSALADLRFAGTVKEWNAISKQERWNEGAAFTKIKCSDGDAEAIEYDGSRGLEYKISDDGTYAILVGIGTCTDKDIVVATTYNGLPVTSVDFSFSKISNVTSIILSDSILTVGGIDEMPDLVSVYFSKSVEGINPESLIGCPNLKNIEVDKDNKKYMSIGNCLIEKATKTLVHGCKESVIPSDGSVTVIGEFSFYGCDWMTDITIPEGIEKINAYAFAGCDSLKNVYLPDSLITLGYGVFNHSSALESVRIGKNLEIIGSVVFDGCSKLNNLSFPKTLKRMGEMVFMECNSLTSVSFEGTCAEWKAIEKVVLWDSGAAFNVIHCSDCDLELYEYDGSRGLVYVQYDSYAQLAGIGTCTDTDIVIASTYNGVPVVIIEPGVFKNNKNIRSVTIPDKVHYIGEQAFAFCTSLESVVMPENLKTLGDDAFNGCTSLKSINIPVGITEIGSYTFSGCESLTEIVIPEGVTVIELEAFYLCGNLQKVTLPSTLESIQDMAFMRCAKLERITIPDSVTNIGQNAFNGCENLTSLTLGKGVELIEENAFKNCSSLDYVRFPKSLRLLANDAFAGCSSLASVHYAGTIQEWNSVDSTGRDYGNTFVWYEGVPAAKISCTDGDVFISPITQTEAYEAAREFLGIPKDQIGEKYLFAAKAKDPSHLDCYRVALCEYVPDIGYMGEYEVLREVYVNQNTGECTEIVFDYPDIPEVFLDVIFNRETFTFVDKEYSSSGYTYKTEECYLKTFELLTTQLFGSESQSYALLDIDGDSVPELIFSYISNTRYRLVLRYYDGKVYGYTFGGDGLMTDCTNSWHEGAGDVRVLDKLYFDGLYLKSRELLRYDSVDPENVKYYVEGKETTKAEYEKFAAQYDGEYLKYTTLDLYPVYVNPFPGG